MCSDPSHPPDRMRLLDVIIGMVAPRLCEACGRELLDGEQTLCMHCVAGLPLCMMSRDDLRAARLPRTVPVNNVYPWLTYTNENAVCSLIREGKYHNRPELIKGLAQMYAHSLLQENALNGVNLLVPVPMYWWKRMRRGYNQADIIAKTIAVESGVNMSRCLKAKRDHRSQTQHSRQGRLHNVRGLMEMRAGAEIAGLHVGIVDDILTTGATVSEAAEVLVQAGAGAVSVFTLAAAESW